MNLSTVSANRVDHESTSNLAKAIRIGLSFVNHPPKPIDAQSTSNDLTTNLKCPGNFCSKTSVSKSSSSSPSSSSSSSSSTSSTSSGRAESRLAGSIFISGRSKVNRTASELRELTLNPLTATTTMVTTSKPITTSETVKSVNLVQPRLADYYADYDPMMGIRIAISLLGIIVMFAIFVVYKSHCNAKKAKRLLPYQGSKRSVSGYRTP